MFNNNHNRKLAIAIVKNQHRESRRRYATFPVLPQCDFKPEKYEGISYERMLDVRGKHLNPALTTYYNKPIAFHQGHKQWLFDIDGKRYLDMYAGICTVSVGHSHPKITEAVTEQMRKLGHVSNVYLHPKIHEYAEKLSAKMPGNLKVVYFVNSGSEANDLAVLMARAYTNNYEVASLMNGYHGMTCQTMAITGHSHYKYPVAQHSAHHLTNPDVYRGIWGGSRCRDGPIQTKRICTCKADACDAAARYLSIARETFACRVPKRSLAAFFAESIQGVGGAVQYPKGFLRGIHATVKDYGGLYVADEVQTGFGRTGDHYWGFEMHDVEPDIVTMAKGIGNGFPLAAVVTTPTIAEALKRAAHFNTFGGNPIACTVGATVLDIIDEERLQQNAKKVGTYLLQRLAELRNVYPIVGDVRGKGLMIGVELIAGDDGGTTTPLDNDKFVRLWSRCLEMGLIVGRGGQFGNVLRIKPPLCVDKRDADFAVDVLAGAAEEICEESYK